MAQNSTIQTNVPDHAQHCKEMLRRGSRKPQSASDKNPVLSYLSVNSTCGSPASRHLGSRFTMSASPGQALPWREDSSSRLNSLSLYHWSLVQVLLLGGCVHPTSMWAASLLHRGSGRPQHRMPCSFPVCSFGCCFCCHPPLPVDSGHWCPDSIAS